MRELFDTSFGGLQRTRREYLLIRESLMNPRRRLVQNARIIANENTFSLRSMWHEDVLYDCLLSPARRGA